MLIPMGQRLQVLLPDSEMAELRRLAGDAGLTVGEWVRRALRAARERQPAHSPEAKLQALRDLARLQVTAPEIAAMLAEIEQGYLR